MATEISDEARREIERMGMYSATFVEMRSEIIHEIEEMLPEVMLARTAIALAEECARLREDAGRLDWLMSKRGRWCRDRFAIDAAMSAERGEEKPDGKA